MTNSSSIEANGTASCDSSLENVNWDVEYEICESEPVDDRGINLIEDVDWVRAIEYDGPSFEETLVSPWSLIYHLRVGREDFGMLVGITFEFSVENNRIVAVGKCHPAIEMRGDYHTMTDEVICERRIIITPPDTDSANAIKEYIEEAW